MPIRKPNFTTDSARSNISSNRNSDVNNSISRSRPSGSNTLRSIGNLSTVRPRVSSFRTPQTNTDASLRRNRAVLIASRKRTAASISSASNNADDAGPSSSSSNSINDGILRRGQNFYTPNHNDRSNQRISLLSSYFRPVPNRNRSESPSAARSRASRIRSKSSGMEIKDSMTKVLEGSEKYLPKIFKFLSWNELLPMREVCKKWLSVISSNPMTTKKLGIIVITNPWEIRLKIFNESSVIWTKFRIEANMFIDLIDQTQLQFWTKHGPFMDSLEIQNRALTLTGFVEILSRCPNLSRLKLRWSPEMYTFNSELIKKYYGINFHNGSFGNMTELCVERSCFLNDNALNSILKWCGGNSLKSLSLTYPPEDQQDPLTRLKPRWTVQPLQSYIDRFGYTGKLQYLDFSWSNICSQDLHVLANLDNLSNLRGINLSYCKLDNDSIHNFLQRKGGRLERLLVEGVPLTEAMFGDYSADGQVCVPKLKCLNVSGSRGNFQNLHVFPHLSHLEEFHASNTSWLDYNKLLPAIKARSGCSPFKILDISGGIKVNGTKQIDINMNKVWLGNLITALPQVAKLNLNYWTQFGKNDNFKIICQSLPQLEELRICGWKELSDSGVTGFPSEKLHGAKNATLSLEEQKSRVFVGSLKNLRVLDLSGCSNISDASVKYGIICVPTIRKFGFDDTLISELGINCIINEIHSIDQISFDGCEKIGVNKTTSKFQRKDGRFIRVAKL